MKKSIKKGVGLLLASALAVSAFMPLAEANTVKIVYRVTDLTGSQPTVTANSQPVTNSILFYGVRSSQVTQLQKGLAALGYDVTVNGTFDIKTLQAVRKFQQDNGLSVNGIVDSRVWTVLNAKLAGAPAPDPQPQPAPQPAPKPAPQPAPAPAPQPQPQPAPQPAPAPGDNQLAQLTQDERRMVELVNQERVKAGLKPLQVDMQIVKVARLKSQDMITNKYFAHNSPVYGSPFEMMKSFGITYRTAGENLAGAATVDRAHTNLMNSPGHRANILNASFTHFGIGIVDGGPYGKMFTQMFVGR